MSNNQYTSTGNYTSSANWFQGGVHVVEIKYVEDTPTYTEWYVDICDGNDAFFGYFSKMSLSNLDNWKGSGKFKVFKNNKYKPELYNETIRAIEMSNGDYKRNENNPKADIGKIFCLAWRQEEFKNKEGQILKFYKPYKAYTVEAYQNKQVREPLPYLKYTAPYDPNKPKNDVPKQEPINVNLNTGEPTRNGIPFVEPDPSFISGEPFVSKPPFYEAPEEDNSDDEDTLPWL